MTERESGGERKAGREVRIGGYRGKRGKKRCAEREEIGRGS